MQGESKKHRLTLTLTRFILFICTSAICFMLSGCSYLLSDLVLGIGGKVPPDSENIITGDAGSDEKLEINISVFDKDIDFINSVILPENESTDRTYAPALEHTDPKRIFYGAGSCEFLRGKKTVVLFFVDDNTSSWNRQSIEGFTDNIALPALQIIKNEAVRWGIELDLEVWRFTDGLSEGFLKYGDNVNPDLYNGGSTKDLPEKTASEMGYSSEMAMRWALSQKAQGDIIPIFALNKTGTSYARNQYIVAPGSHVEHAVVFSDGLNKSTYKASTFAHELLHLYGAEELYKPAQRYALARELYPYDIMCLESRDMSKLKIEAFTAYTLGWTDSMPDICNNENWYTDNYYESYESIVK